METKLKENDDNAEFNWCILGREKDIGVCVRYDGEKKGTLVCVRYDEETKDWCMSGIMWKYVDIYLT